MDKEKILNLFHSSGLVSIDELKLYLSSSDKDIKHEAWNYVLTNASKLPHSLLIELLKFADTGTRYRVWNEIPNFLAWNIFKVEEVKQNIHWFIELLRDSNLTVRFLSWYVSLKPLISLGLVRREEIEKEITYLEELKKFDEYKDFVDEILKELIEHPT